jgi:predicted MFS family arabinose efflux permease
LVQAVCIAVTPLAGIPYIAAVIFLPLGVANSLTNIVMITLAQQDIPKERMGRAMALVQFCSYAPYSLSALLGAVVTRSLGPSFMFEITACGMAAAFLAGLQRDPYRLARRREKLTPAAGPE